jgi:DNA polymerase-3 subunit gamma/tau
MVLALKYRPKNFQEVVGQEPIVQTLTSALKKDKIANAYLFSGLRGSGKTSTARILSKALQCDKGPTSTPCEVCENCIMANQNRHIDIIEMDGASNRKIDDVRDLIEHTNYSPSTGRFKIFIIDEVHMLTNEAFNALLKTLEEPPSYVKFILATTDPLKLPATILSRTQHFRFYKIPTNLIESHIQSVLLKEDISFETEALSLIARAGKGSMRDTMTLLEQAIVYSNGEINLAKTVDMLGVVNPQTIKELFGYILKEDKNSIKELTKTLINYDINSILDEIITYLKDAIYDNSISIITIERFFKIVADTKMFIRYDLDSEFALNLMFFKMVEATKPQKIDDLIKEYEKAITSSSEVSIPVQKERVLTPPPPSNETLFQTLQTRIYDRDKELGECFRESVKFIKYENSELTWESCPSDKCMEMFKRYFSSVIRFLVNETFGVGTKIIPVKCSNETPKVEIKPVEKTEPNLMEKTPEEKVMGKLQEVFGSEIEISKYDS